eukprot:3873589-Pyramimonas_sp.AAC.1
MRRSQHRLDIVLEVLRDEEMRAPTGAQGGSNSALGTAENDDASGLSAIRREASSRYEKRAGRFG